MAAIGTCWASGSWATTAWAANTWAGTASVVGQVVQPFTVQQAAQLFKKAAWDAEAKSIAPFDGRRMVAGQPTVAEQRHRIEATQRIRATAKRQRETALWLASIAQTLEDMIDD